MRDLSLSRRIEMLPRELRGEIYGRVRDPRTRSALASSSRDMHELMAPHRFFAPLPKAALHVVHVLEAAEAALPALWRRTPGVRWSFVARIGSAAVRMGPQGLELEAADITRPLRLSIIKSLARSWSDALQSRRVVVGPEHPEAYMLQRAAQEAVKYYVEFGFSGLFYDARIPATTDPVAYAAAAARLPAFWNLSEGGGGAARAFDAAVRAIRAGQGH